MQMLLLLLLLLGEERNEHRVLIDALLKITRRSAASVAREARVEPANLSRLRTLNGDDQISAEGQLRVLKALKWTGGSPDVDRVHDWGVKDEEGWLALEWLLKDKLNGKAFFRRLVESGETPKIEGPQTWIGQLTISGAHCLICVKPQTSSAAHEMGQLCKTGKPGAVPKSLLYRFLVGKLDESELKALMLECGDSPPQIEPESLIYQMRQLGLTESDLSKCMESWLTEKAQKTPDTLVASLANLDTLNFGGKSYVPSAMTEKQRRKLVTNIARR